MEYEWVMSAGEPINPPKEISFSENKTYYGWIGTPYNRIDTLGVSINKEINLMVDTMGLIFYKTKYNSFGEKNTLLDNVHPFPTYVTELQTGTFNIYPNPFTDRVQIDNSNQNQFVLKIWNLSGVIVLEQIIVANSLQIIELSNLNSVAYVYKLYCDNTIKTGRLLKL